MKKGMRNVAPCFSVAVVMDRHRDSSVFSRRSIKSRKTHRVNKKAIIEPNEAPITTRSTPYIGGA